MKATKIKIRNLFGISVLELDGKSVELSGRNGVGKTSALDAIRYALTNSSSREYVIRNGENEGEIFIETDTGLSIDRKARLEASDYKSIKQGNNQVGSPEAFLKTIFTPLQLDPVKFARMSAKEQNAIILDMIDYEWDLETIRGWFGEIVPDVNYQQNILAVLGDIQAENGYYFQKRQDINRNIRAKEAVISDIEASLPAGYDGKEWENKNIGELYVEIEKIRKENEQIEKAKNLAENYDNKIRGFQADKEIRLAALDKEISAESSRIDSELAALAERMEALREKRATLGTKKQDKAAAIESDYNAKVSRYEAEIGSFSEYADKQPRPIEDLIKKANEAEAMKGHVNEWRRMLSVQEQVEELSEESKTLTKKIQLARKLPGEILESSTIPIEGLTVKDGIPLINGLPISNLSEGEKFSLCIDVAVKNPAGLKIILIDGAEKWSKENREKLYLKCKEKGLQVLATRTTEDDALTIIEL